MNSKQKGGIGVAAVAAFLAEKGDLVYLPLTECGCDLVIDRGGSLMRVEVKSTWHERGTTDLRINAGHYSYRGMKLGKFNGKSVDLLVVYNGNTKTIKEFVAVEFDGRASVTVK